jgi:hypothetical protein
MRGRCLVTVAVLFASLSGFAQEAREEEPQMAEGVQPAACVLENVPYVGPDWSTHLDGPQDFMFPSALGSVMKFRGEPEPYRYRLFMNTSNFGFRVLWHPTRWDSGFDNVWLLAADPLEPIRRMMEAAGYGYELVGNAGVGEKRSWYPREGFTESLQPDELRSRICAEIRSGRPVIAIGLLSGAAVVAGYQDGGKALVGWCMFDEKNPPERDPLGYLVFRDWTELTEAVLFIREKRDRPPLEESLKQGLLWAVQGFRTPQIGEYASGLNAYDTWVQALLDDSRWKADDVEALRKAGDAHFFATLTVAEGRAFGAEAPERLAELRPEVASDLHEAEASYHLMHDLVWRLWQTLEGTVGPADPPLRLTEPGVRRELARLVLLERDLDATAATHLERALLTLGVPQTEFPPASQTESEAGARVQALHNVPGADLSRMVHAGTDGTWVDGTPPVGWMQGKDCTFVGALEAALAPTACPYSYIDLMGYSGLAFRTRWFHNSEHAETPWGTQRWHPVSPHGEGPDEIAALTRATGWQLRREELPKDRNDPAYQHLVTDLVLSLDAGLPAVIGLNTDLATVYGYHIWSMNLILRDYQRPEQEDVRTQANDAGFQSPVIFLDRHEEPLEPPEALLASIRLAVRNATREPSDGFMYGPAALRTWRDDLLGHDTYTDDERNLLFLANWWSLMHLVDAREAAVAFLEGNADLLTGDSRAALVRALDGYRQEARLLRDFADEHLDFIQWYGGTKQASDWDEDTRQAQAELLAKAAELEGEAAKAFEEVLAAEGKNQP